MNSIMIWPALIVLAGATASIPVVEDAGHRSILYWVVIPSLLAGVVAVCTHVVSF